MTRKLPADIPSPELRGGTRPDMPKWQSMNKLPHDKQVLFTDKAKRFQWLGMLTGEDAPLPLYHHGGQDIEPSYWADPQQ
jgi:hypothetical protein